MDRVRRLVGTMVWLRWRLMLNSLRTVRGLGETVAWTLVLLLGGALAILGAVGAGLAVFSGLLHGDAGNARLVLGVTWGAIGFLALFVPLMLGEGRAELAPRRLLQFPVSRPDLFWTGMLGGALSGANLVWYPSMAASVVAAAATGRVSPFLVLPAGLLATISILAAQQALLMGVQWIATSRRLREIVTVLAIFLFVGLAQLPNILNQAHAHLRSAAGAVPPVAARVLAGVVESVPPALAAHLAVPDGLLDGLTGLLGLLLWTGLTLGIAWKLYLGSLGRPAAGAPSRGRGRTGLVRGGLDLLPPDLAGLAAKQLRYILRSTVGRLGLLMSPVLGLVLAFMGRNAPGAILGVPTRDAVFLIVCLMGAMYGSDVVANRFEWDAGGAALYFVTPVDPARVILGLDLGVWLYGTLTAAGLFLAYLVVTGVPGPLTLVTGLLLLIGSRIVYSLTGAVLSILFPVARDMGSSRSRMGLVPALAMMGAMTVTTALFGLPAVLLLNSHHPAAAPVLLLVLVLGTAAAGRLALPRLGRLLSFRREDVLDALESRPG